MAGHSSRPGTADPLPLSPHSTIHPQPFSAPGSASPPPMPTSSLHHTLCQPSIPQDHLVHQFTDPALLLDPSLAASASTDFPIDPALGGGVPPAPEHHLSPVPVGAFHHNIHPAYSIQPQPQPPSSVAGDAAVSIDTAMTNDDGGGQPGPSTGSTASKRGSVLEDSDQELKRLAAENSNIPLKELATRVREDENGPKAERARQILGMRWLLTSCERAADASIAVPRNRVYARYVSMCANERIKPLNPASFGKLVRLMYPEIKTRRLGVRGHSKYHYCGIRLKGDPSSPTSKTTAAAAAAGASQYGSASGSEPPPQMVGEDHLHVLTPSHSLSPQHQLTL